MKNWKLPLALLLALLSGIWLACHKNELQADGPMITAVFAGQVVDENDAPLAGASVTAAGAVATTDVNGVFRLKPIRVPAHNAILHISLPGYFDFSRAYVLQNQAVQTVSVQLLKKQLVHSFLATQSSIAQVGNAQLRFPAGALAKADGSAYSGIVSVFARYLDPEAPDLKRHMPGDLRGINATGDEQTLATFGMIGVELATPGGEPLQVASGKTVEIALPVPPGKAAVAPDAIALWHFDPETARWMEEGSAQKAGSQYVGAVRHFSFWNCDVSLPMVSLSGRVLFDQNHGPFMQASVKLTILSNGWEAYGSTDNKGYFGGKVPANEAIKMEVELLDLCGNWGTLFTQIIGPFSADAALADVTVTIPAVSSTTITGRLIDCNKNPVTNGYIQLSGGLYPSIIFTENDGTFGQPILHCTPGQMTVTGFDIGGLTTSQPLSFSQSGGSLPLGDIEVCTLPTEYAEITIDGKKYSFIGGFEGISEGGETWIYGFMPDQSSVQFSFKNNGQTGTFPLEQFTLYPVSDTLSSINITTQLTQFGAKGQPMIGTLSGTVKKLNAPTQTVSGKYRVLRDN